MQQELDFFEEDFMLEEGLERNRELGKQVRNISYKQTISNSHTDCQRNQIKETILAYPSGITDTEICVITGISKSSVTARRNEIPEVIPIGIAKITDKLCGDRLNTLWGI